MSDRTALILRFPNGVAVPYCTECLEDNIEVAKEMGVADFKDIEASSLNPEPGDICDCCNEPLTSEEEYLDYWENLAERLGAPHLKPRR